MCATARKPRKRSFSNTLGKNRMWVFFFEADKWELAFPKIAEVKEHLRQKGLPDGWPSEVSDTKGLGVCYLKKGKPFASYASDCPFYKGKWLHGGSSATDCAAFGEPIPGIITDLHCSKDYTLCSAYRAKNTQIQEN